MRELNARIMTRFPPPSQRPNFSTALSGAMGGEPVLKGAIGNPNAPLDPFSGAFALQGEGALEEPGGVAGVRSLGDLADSGDLRALARGIAREQGIEESLFEALVFIESGFNPRAVSRAGAQGLTQLMPNTAQSLGVVNPFDPIDNLRGGAKYLSQMIKQFGDVRLALAAYNAGPGRVARYGGIPPFAETQGYVENVLRRAALLEALPR
jgi:soluble lytic murein transglycosylase-like protein